VKAKAKKKQNEFADVNPSSSPIRCGRELGLHTTL
jgi:hypothetical protein